MMTIRTCKGWLREVATDYFGEQCPHCREERIRQWKEKLAGVAPLPGEDLFSFWERVADDWRDGWYDAAKELFSSSTSGRTRGQEAER